MPTVLVTGANRGLGLEFARQYAAAGWRVLAACRDPVAARDLRALAGVTPHRLDVAERIQIEAAAATLSGEAIDLLINNAATNTFAHNTFGDIDDAVWERMLRVNVIGPYRVAEAFAPHVARSTRKAMLFISSRAGSITDMLSGGRYQYRSSKAALNAVVKTLALDLQGKGIICAAVHPGWVRTDMGGAGAPIDAATSVTALRALVERLEPHHNGRFINYDGQELRW